MTPNKNEYHDDELVPPEWLNETFLTDVLSMIENEQQLAIRKYKITPGTVKGDHYASIMFRAIVDYQCKNANKDKSTSIIIKAMPETEGNKKDMLKESEIFETEMGIYAEMKPKLESILRAAADATIFGPQCLYGTLTPRKVMVFEDLVLLGYEVIRDREANIDEVKAALLKLAKWHATSHKLLLETPEELDEYRNDLFSTPHMIENEFVTGGIELFIEMLDTQPGLQQYKQYFQALQPKLIDNCARMFREYRDAPRLGGIYALCHGDFHRKNMMFKHEGEQLKDVLLLDYQIAHVGPVVSDLIYSLYMLMDAEMRANDLDTLLRFYHAHFVETLKRIGFGGRVPQFDDLEAELKRHRSWEIFLVSSFLPMWYDVKCGGGEAEDMLHSVDYRRNMYKARIYVDEVRAILPRFLQSGYFEGL